MSLPESIEIAHQHFTQILAYHGCERHAKIFRVSPRLDGQASLAAHAQYSVHTSIHPLFLGYHHAVGQTVLQDGRVIVTAAVLVDKQVDGVVILVRISVALEKLSERLSEDCAL